MTEELPSYTDVFGVEIEPGDYILSSALTTGRVKVGRADPRKNSLFMSVERQFNYCEEVPTRSVDVCGSNVIVLRKEDGKIPYHILGVPDPNQRQGIKK